MQLRHDDDPFGANPIARIPEITAPDIVVVDDSILVREPTVRVLQRAGHRALALENGFAAQQWLLAATPALLVSDLEMPGGDGWDLLTFCHLFFPHLPVLILSGGAWGRRPEIERWAAGFLPKPFSAREICAEVDRLISRAHLRPQSGPAEPAWRNAAAG